MAKHISKEELTSALSKSLSMSDVIKLVGLPYNGKSTKRLNELFRQYEIDASALSPTAKTKLRIKYPAVEKTCPMCGKLFETKSGHPKEATCCSRQCSNKFFAKPVTDERKKKISVALTKSPHLKECPVCKRIFETKIKRRIFCGRSCKTRHLWADKNYRKHISNSVRSAMLEQVKNGTHSGWKSRKKLEPSFPEKFFMGVLSRRNISYEYECPCGKYFIDFAIHNKKIALEIDGKQHEMSDRKISDVKKDVYLQSKGWTVHRIKWKSIHDADGKQYIDEKIDEFFTKHFSGHIP